MGRRGQDLSLIVTNCVAVNKEGDVDGGHARLDHVLLGLVRRHLFRIPGLGFGVWGLGFGVLGVGIRRRDCGLRRLIRREAFD